MNNFLKIQIVFFAFYGVLLQASSDLENFDLFKPDLSDISTYDPKYDIELERHVKTVSLLKGIKDYVQFKQLSGGYNLVHQKENKPHNAEVVPHSKSMKYKKSDLPDAVQMLAEYRRKNSNKKEQV